MNKAALICFFAVACMVSSCQIFRGKRSAGAVPTVDTTITDTSIVQHAPAIDTVGIAVDTSDAFLWNSLLQRPATFMTFSGKAHVSYEGSANSQDFDVNIRIERDRRIWVSITAILGVEFARVLITPDSLKALDRIHHDAYVMSLKDAGQLLPFPADFYLMQALILGEPLPSGASFKGIANVADTTFMVGEGAIGRHEIAFVSKDSLLFRQDISRDPDHMTVINDRFDLFDSKRFPRVRDVRATSAGLYHHMVFEFDEVKFNQPVEMNFTVPERYQRK
jgi:hypothetical protein